jgi:DNA-binding response OmpR family regulator
MAAKIRFGVYELDSDAMELRKHGEVLRLQEQPFRVLALLAGRPGQIVTREELQEQIWGVTPWGPRTRSSTFTTRRVALPPTINLCPTSASPATKS